MEAAVPAAEFQRVRQALQSKPSYEKMLELYKVMLFQGDYQALKPERVAAPLFMLDNVNFSSAVAADPLPLGELLARFALAPGYATITGDCEIGALLRELEHALAARYARAHELAEAGLPRIIDGTVAVVTSGATGAANAVLVAALHRERSLGTPRRHEIVFNAPCYCLPEAFARTHGLTAKPVEGTVDNGFLPALAEVIAAVGPETLACFLTFPTNPSLASWGARELPSLRRLIEHCQALGVVLVADAVFQDMNWGPELAPEIFALADRPSLLAKIQSPSKDRPLACGYRVGYLVADAALEPWLHQAEALAKNSCNTLSLVWLAFDCLFRLAMLQGGLRREHFALLAGKYLFGYGAPEPDASQMYERVMQAGLFEQYVERLAAFKHTIRSHLAEVHRWLAESRCFAPCRLPDFGNLLLVRVRPPFDLGGEVDFFLDTLTGTHVTSTVGGGFGLSGGNGVWIRVAVGGAPVAAILDALGRLQSYLLERVHRDAPAAAPARIADPATLPTRGSAGPVVDMLDPVSYADACRLTAVERRQGTLRLTWEDGESGDFHDLWLRDNCACRECRHPEAMERTFDLLTVPLSLQAETAVINAQGALEILWPAPHRHVSLFASGWLRAHRHSAAALPLPQPAPWGVELGAELPLLTHAEVMGSDAAVARWCQWLLRWGVAKLQGVPAQAGQVARVGARIGFVWRHSFGDTFDVTVKTGTDSSAYTPLGLPPHTDLPSRAKQPGFQLLHCLVNDVAGGEFIMADGRKIATVLKGEDPAHYAMLSEVPVEFRFVSGTADYRWRGPILEHDGDGELTAVRFNSFLQSPLRLAQEKTPAFYRAYRRFLALASDPAFQLRLRFRPGDLISFDNWRILHARMPFDAASGRRHLQGCYLDRDELHSRLRVLARHAS